MSLVLGIVGVYLVALAVEAARANAPRPDPRWARFRGVAKLKRGPPVAPLETHCRWVPKE